MSYSVFIEARADRELGKLPPDVQERLDAAIDLLAENPRPASSIKLSGRESYRLRVGDYRALYLVDDSRQEVTVTRVGHRRNIYR